MLLCFDCYRFIGLLVDVLLVGLVVTCLLICLIVGWICLSLLVCLIV